MQNKPKIQLNPAYKGPIVIEEYLRKMKSTSSIGRMISNFNKRLFILDFRHMKFYYLPERGAQLSTATDIELESITRVYIDSQLQMLDDGQIWKHGFVILSGKRSYRLVSYAKNNMENLLYALGHLINTETGKPLFDWNEYKSAQEKDPMRGSEPLRPQIFSISEEEKFKEGKVSRSASDEMKDKEGREGNLNMKRSKTQEDPEKHKQVKASNNERQEAQESPEKPQREIREEREQEREKEERRERKANAYKVNNDQKSREGSNEVCRDKERGVNQNEKAFLKSEVDSVGVCESKVVTLQESVQEREQSRETMFVPESREEVSERKVGSIRARVEVLTIDSGENVMAVGKNVASTKNDNSHASKDNNIFETKLVSPKTPFGGRPMAKAKRSSEEEIGSVRVNEVEVVQNKKKSGDNWDAKEKPSMQTNKNHMQQNEQEQDEWENSRDKKGNTAVKTIQENDGWGTEEVKQKKKDAQNTKKNVVEDDDDWDKDMESPPKKNGKKAEVKANLWANETSEKKASDYKTKENGWGSEANNRSVPSHVKNNVVKKVEDDDDWDKDMESPPKKNGKKVDTEVNAKKESSYKVQDNGWGSEANNRSVPSHVKNNVVKKVEDDDDWDKDMESPPRKNGKKVEIKENSWAKEVSPKKEAGYRAQNDDWDQEMSGDNQSKRLDVRAEYRNGIQNSGYGAAVVNKVTKPTEYGGYKQTEMPAAKKGHVHNDWDDDF